MVERHTKGNNNLLYLAVVLVIVIVLIFLIADQGKDTDQQAAVPPEKVYLWNQEDFDNWHLHLKDSTADPFNVFRNKDGLVHITGTPFGYMRTRQSYSDFKLHVEWRWPAEPGNSGVFLHMQEPDGIWPGLIECQLKSGNAGDIVYLGGTDANEKPDSGIVTGKFEESSEKAAGEWNAYDIYSRNDSIILYVNGTLQNICTGPSVDEGFIGLQSEGAPVEFRNVYIIHKK